MGRVSSSAPKLCSLPPTTEAFVENVKRAHYQVCQWMSASGGDLDSVDPRNYGFEEDTQNKMLLPVNISPGTAYAPDYILKLIRCGCGSTGAASPCKGSKCSCTGSMLACTIFCNCGGGKGHWKAHWKKMRMNSLFI